MTKKHSHQTPRSSQPSPQNQLDGAMPAERAEWEVQYMKDHAVQLSSGPVTFTAEQRKMNLDLLDRVRDVLPCKDAYKLSDCDLLYRFLIGKHWDLHVAERYFRDYVTMRVEKHIDDIVGEKMPDALEVTMSPTFGTSVDGMPILWISPDPEKLVAGVKNYSSDEVIRTQIRVMEMTRLAQKHSGKDRNLCVIDLAKISMSTMNSTVMGFVRTLSKVLQEYFPEVFRRLVVFNTGWAVTGIWKVMKPFVDDRVQDKVKFFNTPPSVKSLAEYVPANQVLPLYGGATPSNTVSEVVSAEMKRIRDGPVVTTPATKPTTAAEAAPPRAAAAAGEEEVDGSPTTVASPTSGKGLLHVNSSDLSMSASASPAPEHESPRMLDAEAEASLRDRPVPAVDDHDAHDVQLFTARADSETIGSDSEAEPTIVSPLLPPPHSLSMLTTGGEFPAEPHAMRGLSAVFDDPALTSFDDVDSCELHSIDSASDDYTHFDQSLSTSLPTAQSPPPPEPHHEAGVTIVLAATSQTSAKSPPATEMPVSATAASASFSPPHHAHDAPAGAGELRSPTAPGLAPFPPSVVQINLTERADGSILGYTHNELIAVCRNAHILSTKPPAAATPTGLNAPEENVQPYGGGSGQYVVGQLLVESGHPVHEFVLVCDAQRHARYIVRKSRFRSRLTLFQVIGDAVVATDDRGHHYIEGERVRLAVGVPHRNGVESDWMLYGEDLSSTARARRKVRDLAHSIRRSNSGNDVTAEEATGNDDPEATRRGAESSHDRRDLLAECHAQTANFFGILAGTHPLALFTLLVAMDRMWKDEVDTIQSTPAAGTEASGKSAGTESRDVVSSVKAFFRSGRRTQTTTSTTGGHNGGGDQSASGSATRTTDAVHTDPISEESSHNLSPSSSGSARRFFKKLTKKE